MKQKTNSLAKAMKQRLTAFIDPIIMKRAKIRGALEGLTLSEVVEKALDFYAPVIEKGSDQHLNVKFMNYTSIESMVPEISLKKTVNKH